MTAQNTELRLYNTLSRSKEVFVPIDAKNVRMYVCGPTVYDFAHIGNARPVIVFDVLFRLLRHIYGENHVTYARNITDVDDKINARAVRDYPDLPFNEAIRRVTTSTNAQFQADVTALGNLAPTHQPRATEHMDEMRALIDRLVVRGVAYVADDHVLFSPSAMNARSGLQYGSLARRSLDEMIAGARVDVASYKRDEMDFVLWKPSKQGEPGWPSPAGITVAGRPGWHIECSAMAMAKLLEPFGGGLQCDDPEKNIFDIHAGGIDLVFPHHENEIAQSCCAFDTQRMANIWMHNGFLQVEGQKMSKSLGNFITIRDVLNSDLSTFSHLEKTDATQAEREAWIGLAARFSMLQTLYREPINWTAQRLEESSEELLRWYRLLREEGFVLTQNLDQVSELVEALADDINSWAAITVLRKAYKDKNFALIGQGLALLGLFDPQFMTESSVLFADVKTDQAEAIEAKIHERLQLIAAKNWHEADRIRDALLADGIQLKDGKDPVSGERITTWDLVR
ncbi:cysteine--tRNA ligase [Brucellaceae bacterium C25G]